MRIIRQRPVLALYGFTYRMMVEIYGVWLLQEAGGDPSAP
jgi:hypothetical protein